MPTVLITGGSGFLGIPLIKALLRQRYRVRVLDIEALNCPELESEVEFVKGDVRDGAIVEAVCGGARFVVHCVAVQPVSRSKREIFRDVNVKGTRNVLSASRRHRVERFLYISSSATYGVPREVPITERTAFNPVCDYGQSKAAAERLCNRFRADGLDVVILRPRVLIGEGRLGVYQLLFSWIADRKPIFILGSGKQKFQALGVNDMVQACLLAMRGACRNQDVNLGAMEYGTFRGDLRGLMDHAGNRSPIVSLPVAPARAALWSLDLLDVSPLTPWHYLTSNVAFFYDITKARTLLGWQPKVSNLEMLVASYDWYLSHRHTVDRDLGVTHRKSLRPRAFGIVKALT